MITRTAMPQSDEYDAAYYGMEGKRANYDRYGPQSVPHWSMPLAVWLRSNTHGPYLDAGAAYGHLCRDLNTVIENTGIRLVDGRPSTFAIGIDWSPWAYEHRVTPMLQQGDIRRISYPDDSFNTITSLDVLEHFVPEECQRVMRELVRVGGRGHLQIHLLGCPFPDKPSDYEHEDPTHCNPASYDWYVQQFQQLGCVLEPDIIDQLNAHSVWTNTDWNGRWLVMRYQG